MSREPNQSKFVFLCFSGKQFRLDVELISAQMTVENKSQHKKSGWILVLFFFSATAALAYAPRVVETLILGSRSLTQSERLLPAETQAAIETLAQQQIKQEQANATLPFIAPVETTDEGIFQSIVVNVKEFTTRDPVDRAKLRIKKIDRLIGKLQRQVGRDKLVALIKQIGAETDKIVTDPKVRTDREVLTLQIEQYNRLQLIIQQLEDRLPFTDYLAIEDARLQYLVASAVRSIDAAPSLEAIHSIAVPVVASFVGEDFAELKAMETMIDFEDKLRSEARLKLLGLEKELASAFEKKMLRLPRDVRNRKLQSYIHYAYGDPLLQARAFERMKDFLSDREMILGIDSLKEVAVKRLAERIFELDNQADLDAYVDRVMKNREDLKILGEMQIAINSGQDTEKIARLATMQTSVQNKIARFLEQMTSEELSTTDLMDVVLTQNLNAMVAASEEVSTNFKQQFSLEADRTLDRFIKELGSSEFLTRSKLAYNPVSTDADVRILISHPQSMVILQNLRTQVPAGQRAVIDKAIRASAGISAEHLLSQVNDPKIFTDYEQYITKTVAVNKTFQRYEGRSFNDNLAKKAQVVQKVALAEKQQLYEVMQQITQSIFAGRGETDLEKQLPLNIRQEVQELKKLLSARNVPQLTTPEGISLAPIAPLSHDIQHAIVQAAKARIRDGQKSEEVKLDFSVTAADLDIKKPRILPDSPLYPLKHLSRRLQLVMTFDSLSRVELLIKQNNERTLEAMLLLQKSDSRKSVDLALETLLNIEKDFNRLKTNTGKLKEGQQPQLERVDLLIDAIIKNGLARQTVFGLIEDHVYGADYVRVEKIRQQILKDGIETLLQLSGGNAQVLVAKLEQTVNGASGSKFKELKAIELLVEIKRFQPEKIGQVLEASEIRLVKAFEANLLTIDKEERERELLAYADGMPGNPVRHYQAYEELKESFENKETLTLAYNLENEAVENLVDIVSGITDDLTLREFATEVVGTEPQDLKIIIEIEDHVETPGTLESVATPIEQKIEEIKTIIEEEVVEEFIENPQSLFESDLISDQSQTGKSTIGDVEVIQELVEIIEQTPQATPEIIETIEQIEEQIVSEFIETVTNNPTQALEPAPEVIETLVKLKEESPPAIDAQIDVAIRAEVEIIQEELETAVTSPEILETYITQIEESSVIAKVINQVGGEEFQQVLEETASEVSQNLTQEQTLLQETISQVQEEIFASPVSSPSPVEETLSQSVQTEIAAVKTEVSVEQIPAVTTATEITVTVESVQTSTEQPTSAPTTESAPAAPVEEPAAPTVGL